MDNFQFDQIFQEEDLAAIDKHEKELREVANAARRCLNHEEFQKYRTRMVKVEHDMSTVMISFTNDYFNQMNGDMAFYGAKIARYLTKIQNLRLLLKAVEYDAEKGIGQPEGKDEKDSRS